MGQSLMWKALKGFVDITVKTLADRDAMLTYKRRWGMVVAVYDDGENNGFYYLKKGKNSDTLGDNLNWKVWEDHDRLHDIDSPDDHSPAAEADKGKFVRANPDTGKMELQATHTTYAVNHMSEVIINHGLDKYPSVQVFDGQNKKVITEVEHIDTNNTKISWLEPHSGTVIFS